jgi:hypothetical protein
MGVFKLAGDSIGFHPMLQPALPCLKGADFPPGIRFREANLQKNLWLCRHFHLSDALGRKSAHPLWVSLLNRAGGLPYSGIVRSVSQPFRNVPKVNKDVPI